MNNGSGVGLRRLHQLPNGDDMIPNFNVPRVALIVLTLTAGTARGHVDGRAHHPAGHRQRHVDPDLRHRWSARLPAQFGQHQGHRRLVQFTIVMIIGLA